MLLFLLNFACALAAQVTVTTTDTSVGGWHVFPPGSTFSLQVTVSCSGCGTITGVWKDENDVTLASLGTFTGTKTVTSPSNAIGHYDLTLSSSSSTDTINERPAGKDKRFGFAILPVPPPTSPRVLSPTNPFGMVQLNFNSDNTFDPYFLCGYIKTLTWDVTGPEWWSYEGDRRRARGLQDVPLISGAPWSDSPINTAGIQNKIQPFFAGDPLMLHYELGLEENLGGAFGTGSYFSDLAAKAQAVRGAANAAGVSGIKLIYQIVDTSPTGDVVKFINSVALAKFQILSMHPYRWNNFEDPCSWMETFCTGLRSALNNAGRSDMDIWFTEIGTPINTNPGGNFGYPPNYNPQVAGITRQREADFITKTHVIAFSNGIKKIFWYHYQDGGTDITYAEDSFGLVDYWGYKTPAYTAYMRLLAALYNKVPTGTPRKNYGTNSVWSYEFVDTNGTSVVVTWIYPDPGTTKTVALTDVKSGLDSTGIVQVTSNVGTPMSITNNNIMLGIRPVFLFLGASAVDPCQGNTCSGHGVCSSTGGVAKCTCIAGWEGPACNTVSNCAADSGWPSTSPGATAVKSCGATKTGNDTRQCSSSGTWGVEVNTCVALPTCTDGMMNQDETAVDCGGSVCLACLNCPTINCGVHGKCVEGSPPTCTCNSSYTGDRCQYPPDPCLGQTCSSHGTCSQGVCNCTGGYTGSTCQNPPAATCSDGIQNQGETGVDCGGPCVACPTYSWELSTWTDCSVTCGGGLQTRTANCVSSPGVRVNASFCSALHAPDTLQVCNPDTCPTYTWQAGTYGPCNTDCGGGQQTRSVVCISSLGNVMVTPGPTTCPLGAMPVSVQTCNTAPCAANRWVAGLWSNCSRSCGGGQQARTVTCQAPNNTVVPSNQCNETTLGTQQSCNLQTCNVYIWQPCKQWSTCSASCGGGDGMLGQQWREVFCVDQSGNVVDTSLCDSLMKPIDTSTVCNTQRCTSYNWMVSSPGWGPCLNGIRTRSFHCHRPDGTVGLYSECTQSAGTVPLTSIACTPNTCLSGDCPNNEIDQVFSACKSTDFGTSPTCSAGCSAAIRALLQAGATYSTPDLQLCIETYSGPTNPGVSTQLVSTSVSKNAPCATVSAASSFGGSFLVVLIIALVI